VSDEIYERFGNFELIDLIVIELDFFQDGRVSFVQFKFKELFYFI
jgi:hypothetical protein